MDTFLKRRLDKPCQEEEKWPKKFVGPDGQDFILNKGDPIPDWLKKRYEEAERPLPC